MKTSVFLLAGVYFLTQFSCSPKSTHPNCNLPPEPGVCLAAVPRYYYNQQTGQCQQYTWGGCGDFAFETLQQCETNCK